MLDGKISVPQELATNIKLGVFLLKEAKSGSVMYLKVDILQYTYIFARIVNKLP